MYDGLAGLYRAWELLVDVLSERLPRYWNELRDVQRRLLG